MKMVTRRAARLALPTAVLTALHWDRHSVAALVWSLGWKKGNWKESKTAAKKAGRRERAKAKP
jgi:hypothetical protein